MIIAFKHRLAEPSFVDWLIAKWTNTDWVHCELIFESYGNCCVSARPSTMTAVGVKPFDEVVRDEAYWSFYQVPGIDAEGEREIMGFMLAQTAASYNYSGLIWTQVFRKSRLIPGEWFCSELCFQVLWAYSDIPIVFAYPASVDPAELRDIVKKSCTEVHFSQ